MKKGQVDLTSYWIRNPHGVVVALPKHLYERRIRQYGWDACDPEPGPAVKRYPVEGELTEKGERRREHREQRAQEAEARLAAAPTAQPVATQAQPSDPGVLSPEAYRALGWQSLRSYALSRGVDVTAKGMTKETVIAELDKGMGISND